MNVPGIRQPLTRPLVVSSCSTSCLLVLVTACEEEDEWSGRETETCIGRRAPVLETKVDLFYPPT